MSFNLHEYVDVAERIRLFYERWPEGRLRRDGEPSVMRLGDGKEYVVYKALAYRTPDDPLPAPGTAWEPWPGATQFTKDSELMNAETAAIGRAIVMAGIGSKKIASVEEVRNRRQEPESAAPPSGRPSLLEYAEWLRAALRSRDTAAFDDEAWARVLGDGSDEQIRRVVPVLKAAMRDLDMDVEAIDKRFVDRNDGQQVTA